MAKIASVRRRRMVRPPLMPIGDPSVAMSAFRERSPATLYAAVGKQVRKRFPLLVRAHAGVHGGAKVAGHSNGRYR